MEEKPLVHHAADVTYSNLTNPTTLIPHTYYYTHLFASLSQSNLSFLHSWYTLKYRESHILLQHSQLSYTPLNGNLPVTRRREEKEKSIPSPRVISSRDFLHLLSLPRKQPRHKHRNLSLKISPLTYYDISHISLFDMRSQPLLVTLPHSFLPKWVSHNWYTSVYFTIPDNYDR